MKKLLQNFTIKSKKFNAELPVQHLTDEESAQLSGGRYTISVNNGTSSGGTGF